MNKISDFVIPVIVSGIIIFGMFKKVDVFSTFISGAKKGFKIVLDIAPSLIALILAINMIKNSGALNMLCSVLSPITSFLGIPSELTPLTILSPISGSGSVTVYENILKDVGPDSFIGRCASVMMGSSETTFYAITIYYGSCNIKNTRHTLPSAICANIVSFIFSAKIVSLFIK